MEDLNLFNLTKEERVKIYNIYLCYYSYVRHTESYQGNLDNDDIDFYILEYDLAHITGWTFRDMCKDFGIKVVFESTSDDPVELYKIELEKFLEDRRIK